MIVTTNRLCRLLLLLFGLIVFGPVHGQVIKSDWKLVWSDEFQGDGQPDENWWSFSGRKSADWACYCSDDLQNAELINGMLHLRGTPNTNTADTIPYRTGCISTKGKFSFRYGKVEVRARLGKGQGSWPAIWLMPEKSVYGSWPRSGEIDIVEQLNFDTIVYQTVHTEYVDVLKQKDNPKYFSTASFKPEEFNVFSLEWYPDRLDFFVNGSQTFSYPKVDGLGVAQWPFDQQFYIILDQALGGSWAGPVNSDHLPVEMQVDWVRVYQKANENTFLRNNKQ
ncbi:glycoside hydrolase family 16 protein [Mangrovibacterium marinum]|uniref:Glycosyl hydrolase family 16 n=1 Tax=Mangrovibacterium marinum TaxID=1639118 RepID=A0A2T5BXW9_9BACT|nr:glycoside hydrolase family 16 protein [Mangrovibacterium marinum]PTN06292.1 glycosyl hydrolase family 16 [Mangrovibacterium marinum]